MLAVDLLHIDRTIGNPVDKSGCPDLQLIDVDKARHHFFHFPAGAPLSSATMEPCLKTIFKGELSVFVSSRVRRRTAQVQSTFGL